MAADNARQRFQDKDIHREDNSDGEEAGKPDTKGRTRPFGALKSEFLAGKRTILLPSRVAQGQLGVLEGLKALTLGEKEWHCCWVLKEEIESASSDWRQLEQLPGVHVVRSLQADLGPHISGERTYDEIAVCDSYRRQLLSNGFQLQAVSIEPDDWTVPSNEEIRVHGMRHAEETVVDHAEDYIRCASEALESGLGPGLDEFYRRFAPSGVRVTVEWIILMRRLLTADDKLFHRFSQHCVALCLSLLQDMEGLVAEEVILRGLASWREFFRSIRGDRLRWPSGVRTVELHDIAVLRYIMDHSGFDRDPESLQHCFDDACSSEEKVGRLGSLFDLGMGPHAGSNEDIVSEAFSRAQVWEEGTWEAAKALALVLVPGCLHGR